MSKQAVISHPQNRDLFSYRDPSVLSEDDEVFIPNASEHTVTVSSGETYYLVYRPQRRVQRLSRLGAADRNKLRIGRIYLGTAAFLAMPLSACAREGRSRKGSAMGRALRWVGLGVGCLVALAGAAVGYLYLAFPIMPSAPERHVESSPELLARGKYLAENVAVCIDCHSDRDWSRFSGPVVPGTLGKGGERFGHELGFPGDLVSKNITPHKLGSWSDGEVARALTVGVTPDGRALFPMMPYKAYGKLCRDDVDALVSYVRSLPAIDSEPGDTKLDFPVNLIVRTLPSEETPPAQCPDRSNSVKYGEYLVNGAGCIECHTKREGPNLQIDFAFSGGAEFPMKNGKRLISKNITPHVSGIGRWSRAAFVERFSQYRDPANLHEVAADDLNTVMPWSLYAGMTDDDLGAVYDYLRTVKPIATSREQVASR